MESGLRLLSWLLKMDSKSNVSSAHCFDGRAFNDLLSTGRTPPGRQYSEINITTNHAHLNFVRLDYPRLGLGHGHDQNCWQNPALIANSGAGD